MPSSRSSFPSFGSTTCPSLYSYLRDRSRGKGSIQARMFSDPYLMANHLCHFSQVEHFGSPRFLGSPLMPLLCSIDPGHATLPLPTRPDDIAPANQTTKATAIKSISGLIHIASALAVYASRFGFPYTGKTRFRLGGSPYRAGFEPAGLLLRISNMVSFHIIPTLQT